MSNLKSGKELESVLCGQHSPLNDAQWAVV